MIHIPESVDHDLVHVVFVHVATPSDLNGSWHLLSLELEQE